MKPYLNTLAEIYHHGFNHPDRTGTGRRSCFGMSMRFNMADGFPLVTTRKINFKAVFYEMLWFIRGSTNIKELQDVGVHIWDSWAVNESSIKEIAHNAFQDDNEDRITAALMDAFNGSIGPMYGYNWRHAPVSGNVKKAIDVLPVFEDIASDKIELFKKLYEDEKPVDAEKNPVPFEEFAIFLSTQKIDQLQNLILSLKRDPFSARHVMSVWIPEFISYPGLKPEENVMAGRGALAPCHVLVQCFVTPTEEGEPNKLSLLMYQRSADFPVGSCFNIAQYALLLHLLAHVTDMQPYELIYSTGDTHIYLNQLEGVEKQLKRDPLPLPKLRINTTEKDLFKIKFEDIEVIDYQSHEPIVYPVSK